MTLDQTYGFTRCAVGVARRDITPPVGIYARSWGAARHDVAEGVHRPMTATAAALRPLEGDGPELVIVALDLGGFPYRPDEPRIRGAILAATGLSEDQLLINASHTHAGASVNTQLGDRPGAALVAPYLERMVGEVAAAINEAREGVAPAWITYGYGRCSLATNRDFWAPELGRYICGYNPAGAADDTVLVARVTTDDGTTVATLVNYACHPTTLAWENRLLSPDYIGAMREVLEKIYGGLCLFLYGAAGELGPRNGFVGDTEVADRNGRQLGYAAAAALERLPPPGTRLVYTGVVASGANLATWDYRPIDPADKARSTRLSHSVTKVGLARKSSLTAVDPPSADKSDPVAEAEKAMRRRFIQEALGDDPVHQMPIWAWRLGDALLVACPNEAYSYMQTELRARFPGTPVLVLGCTNGSLGYLPPREAYGTGRYQEQQSPFLPGCLELVTEAAAEALAKLKAEG